mmetsp:Transcript_36585/g.72341  ORF Transcript_36585/g.72341 Transcript_36585/m.72341 type:complete len:149 (+) Transcript_36585:50-496(+)|eukprot:CAMPEP_0172811472 /NCGR_PEP_ID=MMETSP1075-20121228/9432_1 /TAXON_ID=2916 /ORGANISM="Ceratium fusus, Strain PA161109" /LENGTH=148 /DNA_ID=CAMNT_0013650893 /DNA_START=91 /DNA_END=537 /DNA_ORIENTATION=+
MGNKVNCQPADCKCKQLGGDCEGNADIVEESAGEVVDMNFVDQKKAGSGQGGGGRRRQAFDIELLRTGVHWRTLGLLVSPDDNPQYLIIDDIWEPSLISEWNNGQDEDKKVRPGDMITAVNGQRCGGEAMLELIQSSGKSSKLTLRIE